MFAAGDTVAFHTVGEADLEFLAAARNDPAIRRPLTVNHPSNGEQAREFFENAISEDDSASFLVCADGDDGEPEAVGSVVPFDADETAGTATVAYWVVPEHQGNGYVSEATELALDYAFEERRLAKVFAHVLVPNEGSWHVLEKLGFQREGRQRKESFVDVRETTLSSSAAQQNAKRSEDGERVDTYRYGLLAEEWLDTSGP